MQPQSNITDCYNKTANRYADNYFHELEHKHLDQILLQAFAKGNRDKGKMIDLGCGPGQTTRFLREAGVAHLLGTDLSPQMVAVAGQLNPGIPFETADMLALHYDSNSFGAAVAFYAIVHFTEEQVRTAFAEVYRILKPGGQFLFSFHTGTGIVHMDEFLGEAVDIDFHFFETDRILDALKSTGFAVIDCIERRPYKETEYPSIRAYIQVQKTGI